MRDRLRDWVREWLGTADLNRRLLPHLRRQEVMLARLHADVTALSKQQPPGPTSTDQ